ncbi:MAG TPA: hypothetical protein VMW24_26965 [Sedimentisphaerales bacterium]|nr:hypothetical protein [Sedimentisphaerales bacterium]
MEWSGICRKPGSSVSYYAISDHVEGIQNQKDAFVYEIEPTDRHFAILGTLAVLSPGGGSWANHDWEDIAAEGDKIWILENVQNGSEWHRVIECKVSEHEARVQRVYKFFSWDDVDAMTVFDGFPVVAMKNWTGDGGSSLLLDLWDGFGAAFSPIRLCRLDALSDGFLTECSLSDIETHGAEGVCVAADREDGMLLLWTFTGGYLLNSEKAVPVSHAGRGIVGGACFAHDGGVLVMNERGRLFR